MRFSLVYNGYAKIARADEKIPRLRRIAVWIYVSLYAPWEGYSFSGVRITT